MSSRRPSRCLAHGYSVQFDAVIRDASSSTTPSFPRRREPKQTAANWALLATRLGSRLRARLSGELQRCGSRRAIPHCRHSGAGRNPYASPRTLGPKQRTWVPSCDGMTTEFGVGTPRSFESREIEVGKIPTNSGTVADLTGFLRTAVRAGRTQANHRELGVCRVSSGSPHRRRPSGLRPQLVTAV